MEIQHFSHHHPLVFIQYHSVASKAALCLGCEKPVEGWSYGCNQCEFYLHNECAELELAPQIQHPFHPKHPLTLLPKSPYGDTNWCDLCGKRFQGFAYNCNDCGFDLHINCALLQSSIAANFPKSLHPHPFFFIQNHNNEVHFDCSGCQKPISGPFYHCSDCTYTKVFNLHKECAELPLEINHPCDRKHPNTLLPQPPTHPQKCSCSMCRIQWKGQNQVEDGMCRVCYLEVDTSYGSYRCSTSDCNYIAHARCATDKAIWDGTIMLEGYDERSEVVVDEPWNLITDVVEQIRIGELMVASEIKHSHHDHNLRLTFSGKTKDDDSQCDGCTGPISTPFYSCEQCKFFLHKDCAELPKQMPHPFHKHLLALSNSHDMFGYSCCNACGRWYQGFSYRCYEGNCSFEIDIQCILLLDTLKHPSHEHSLFLVHNNEGTSCSVCFETLGYVAYRCMKRCDFNLDVHCATLPLTAWYKYDRHPLTLTHFDDFEPYQYYYDLCEKERERNRWFYYCVDCDNSLHLNYAIGDLPYVKFGNEIKSFHKHPLTIVKNIWNCPSCKIKHDL
ncbi:hypothetical protein GOBAR_AA40485 [Gossypium barbadense]|uniref:Phorbol-ester/DAG-type domain-containing protein n=1 Tax=Gossypium barbadense TaxID=3634 RepID=A0A2P5VN01_GOSBA|nr:hypothetical protein GOBAR_AA40485 [Gossypium barbadense]